MVHVISSEKKTGTVRSCLTTGRPKHQPDLRLASFASEAPAWKEANGATNEADCGKDKHPCRVHEECQTCLICLLQHCHINVQVSIYMILATDSASIYNNTHTHIIWPNVDSKSVLTYGICSIEFTWCSRKQPYTRMIMIRMMMMMMMMTMTTYNNITDSTISRW